jgi:hypothetical protein
MRKEQGMYLRNIACGLFVLMLFAGGNRAFARQTVELDLNHYHFHYNESIGDSETAWMNGGGISYKNQDASGNYWRFRYEQTKQNTNYDGATQDGTPVKTITNNGITNTEVIFAVPADDSPQTYMYTGYGYHTWDRNVTGSGGALEKYSWSYLPLGYRHDYRINSKWDGAVDFSLRLMFGGAMKAENISGVDPFRVSLGNKPGARLEVPCTYKVNSQWSMRLTPWYEYSGISQSNSVQVTSGGSPTNYLALEPDSMNHQFGVNVGVSYNF